MNKCKKVYHLSSKKLRVIKKEVPRKEKPSVIKPIQEKEPLLDKQEIPLHGKEKSLILNWINPFC
ncbi:hypothetical protein [Lewinella cohaerens]|uniref:hypothetical protein n=1 Tax=Lewinella cohaerens TaxID=70995 RepID=UPI0012EBDD7F|nr:hypothetical protein [Lewinella cohaerens]